MSASSSLIFFLPLFLYFNLTPAPRTTSKRWEPQVGGEGGRPQVGSSHENSPSLLDSYSLFAEKISYSLSPFFFVTFLSRREGKQLAKTWGAKCACRGEAHLPVKGFLVRLPEVKNPLFYFQIYLLIWEYTWRDGSLIL